MVRTIQYGTTNEPIQLRAELSYTPVAEVPRFFPTIIRRYRLDSGNRKVLMDETTVNRLRLSNVPLNPEVF